MFHNSLGIDPTRWGPFFWSTIDAVAAVFDPTCPQSKEFTLLFFHSLQGVIPCFQCRNHYCLYFQDHSLQDALDSKKQLLEWILRLKNAIQERLGDRPTYTLDQYVRRTESLFQIALTIQPRMAVVMSVTPHQWDALPSCLEALLDQTILPSRVVLCASEVDAPKTDFLATLPVSFPDLSLVVLATPQPQTPSENKNRGLNHCQESQEVDAVLLLQCTDRWHPQKLWILRETLLQHPKASAVIHTTGPLPSAFPPLENVPSEPLIKKISVLDSQLLVNLGVCPDIRFQHDRAENDLLQRIQRKHGHVWFLPPPLSHKAHRDSR